MGRKPNTETRRAEIIDALLQEMSEVGYERASTKSIAARAQLAPGLLHYHFKSKQDILLALVDRLIADADLRLEHALSTGSASARLQAYVSARVGLGPQSDSAQVRAWVSVLAEAMGQARVRKRVATWLSADHLRLTTLFRQAGSGAAKEHASMLLAMMLGSFSLHAVAVPGIPPGYAEKRMREWIVLVLGG